MAIQMVPDSGRDVMRAGVRINWGSIFAGTFMTLAFGTLFFLLGNAIGLGAVVLTSPTASTGLRTGAWIYHFVTLCASFYIGAYGGVLIGAVEGRNQSILHGLTMWALSGVSAVVFGFMYSNLFALQIKGVGADDANWLLACLAVGGALLAAVGSVMANRMIIRRPGEITQPQGERIGYERKVA